MIYVCGDSFAVPDPEHGPMWVELLQQKLSQPVCNLAQVCASNLLISQQLDSVINPDFVIVLFTASTRDQCRSVPWSWNSLDSTTPFDQQQLEILQQYRKHFVDIDTYVSVNQHIIEACLQRLVDRRINFCFDQGGFEHKNFGGRLDYFKKYNAWRSELCLWDWAPTRPHRPYYHITDITVHQRIAEYYFDLINEFA